MSQIPLIQWTLWWFGLHIVVTVNQYHLIVFPAMKHSHGRWLVKLQPCVTNFLNTILWPKVVARHRMRNPRGRLPISRLFLLWCLLFLSDIGEESLYPAFFRLPWGRHVLLNLNWFLCSLVSWNWAVSVSLMALINLAKILGASCLMKLIYFTEFFGILITKM